MESGGDIIYRFILIYSILITMLSGCSSDQGYIEILDEQGYNSIIHTEERENGVVVFYIEDYMNNNADEDYSALGASFIKKTIFGWTETLDRGGHSSSGSPELTSQYLYKSDDDSPFPVLYGVINNPKIKDIRIINLQNNSFFEAEIIDNEEQRIWYYFPKKPKKDAEFEIQGLTDDGKVLTSIINSNLLQSNSSIGTLKE